MIRHMVMGVLVLVGLVLAGGSAAAQTTKLGPTDTISVSWPAASVAADGLNAPDGYRIKARAVTGGAILKAWEAGADARSLVLTELPPGAFTLAVHPFNVAGEAGASNVTVPFGRAAIPESLAGVTAIVIPVP